MEWMSETTFAELSDPNKMRLNRARSVTEVRQHRKIIKIIAGVRLTLIILLRLFVPVPTIDTDTVY